MDDPLARIICDCQQSNQGRRIDRSDRNEGKSVQIIDIPTRKQIHRYSGNNFQPIVVDVLERN